MNILKKYKLKTEAIHLLGMKYRSSSNVNPGAERTCLTKRLCHKVVNFYIRDDNSRICPGKKNTLTKAKKKMQRRILLDNIKSLHAKFLMENKLKISYSVFTRLRPFWVVFPTERDRNTCLCKLCENTQFMINGLFKAKAINTADLDTFVENKVCSTDNHACMYSDCQDCSNEQLDKNKDVLSDDIVWFEWRTRKETRTIKKNNKTEQKEVTYTVKEEVHGTVDTLYDKFDNQLERYMKHNFNSRHQFKYYKEKRESLAEDECIIHVDFSENYVCKMSKEIQSMHFGASRKQITLQTGIVYVGQNYSKTFCTVSDSLIHGPSAIWAHLKPVMQSLKTKFPHVNKVEFFSDGPTSQYRQKANFYLLTSEPESFGFKSVKWSFFESGHGKGIPDAVGGTVKRVADSYVKYGNDITCAKDFANVHHDSKTDIYTVDDDMINKEQCVIDSVKLQSVPGTMKLHQVFVEDKGRIGYRDLSCKFEGDDNCNGHGVRYSNLLNIKDNGTGISKKHRKQTANHPGTTKPSEKKQEKPNKHNSAIRKTEFKHCLKQMSKCSSYAQLEISCQETENKLSKYQIGTKCVSITENGLSIDEEANKYIPQDFVKPFEHMYPVEVATDGNCLPSSGSVLAFGEPSQVEEMRVRIVWELVRNKVKYLDNRYLQTDNSENQHDNMKMQYAQYSDTFIPGTMLNDNQVETLYEQEVMAVSKDKSYMGIWQIHALASVLGVPIYSVYPDLGSNIIRRHLNRKVLPLEKPLSEKIPVSILWTSTRDDLLVEHWVPNHFVPIVSLTASEDDNRNLASADQSLSDREIHAPNCYIGKYVILKYLGKLYPGYVEESGENDLFIECMHRVGRKAENKFFWPKKIKDKHWYDYENLISVIQEPKLIEGSSSHYSVNSKEWEDAVKCLE